MFEFQSRVCHCSCSMDTFAAILARYFISSEGCDSGQQNHKIFHSIIGMSSSFHLLFAARFFLLCEVFISDINIYFCTFSESV